MHAYRDQYAQLFNGGQDVVLIAISTDTAEDLASWAHDDDFPFLMASDTGAEVGRAYGAFARPGLDNRNLFVIGPDGRVVYRATPFNQIDPTAYTALAEAIDGIAAQADNSDEGK